MPVPLWGILANVSGGKGGEGLGLSAGWGIRNGQEKNRVSEAKELNVERRRKLEQRRSCQDAEVEVPHCAQDDRGLGVVAGG
jgi:hypothetical protein